MKHSRIRRCSSAAVILFLVQAAAAADTRWDAATAAFDLGMQFVPGTTVTSVVQRNGSGDVIDDATFTISRRATADGRIVETETGRQPQGGADAEPTFGGNAWIDQATGTFLRFSGTVGRGAGLLSGAEMEINLRPDPAMNVVENSEINAEATILFVRRLARIERTNTHFFPLP